ncbi:hypothetical protein FH966_08660 [Lentibacillus cibarius]|uniref:Uncharacterized protein n=1 Tax=Lentibacillus cibarius TaxID=2583219 RepID=A0A549YIP0_9BACI|nr:hypothetical protein [Lentibacillus cibarius]TRM11743.1 hypothetical protein FH966_08660 [Lentibacillus cibarius]
MYVKYSLGFLIASLIQAGIVMFAENTGISQLGAKLTLFQLITHILAGQVAGYILLIIIRKVDYVQNRSLITISAVWGALVWVTLVPLNAAFGKVVLPWEAGIGTIMSSLLAFIVFGFIATYTIKHYGYENRKTSDPQTI